MKTTTFAVLVIIGGLSSVTAAKNIPERPREMLLSGSDWTIVAFDSEQGMAQKAFICAMNHGNYNQGKRFAPSSKRKEDGVGRRDRPRPLN